MTELPSGKAKLHFYPSSMDSIAVNDDVSFKLLYSHYRDTPPFNKMSLTLNDIIETIPGIQIREFLPDTRLDQCINMFTDIMKNMTSLMKSDEKKDEGGDKKKKDDDQEIENLFSRLTTALKYVMKYMVGTADPDFFDDLGNFPDLPFSSYKDGVYKTNGNGPAGYSVMAFPFTLYYKLQSCTTTNIYEIPAIDSSKRILESQGKGGWTSGGDILSEGGFRVSKLLSKIPLIGDLANMVLGNIGINYMPWWNAEAGAKTPEPTIEITFDLYNDSFKAAMNNFIFVNTIIPNNRWIQYNMFQHSSNLYDVKIEGINRLYACAGDFSVSYEGILRDPPWEWVWELSQKHLNKNLSKARFYQNAMKNKLIKIPDVYKVKLTFQSLLPANFNNFIFNYVENANHLKYYKDHIYDQSMVSKILPTAISRATKRIVALWKSGKSGAEAEKAANEAVPEVKATGSYEQAN